VSIRVPPSLRPAAGIGRTGLAAALLALAACAGNETRSAGADGMLYARGLDAVGDLYIAPISSRRMALAGVARLSRLDPGFRIADGLGTGFADALTVSYDGRDIAYFAVPADTDSRQWGGLIANVINTAKQASPHLAALPQETIDTAIFNGVAAALDRFSHYSPPEMARDQRAARDGFGGVGVTLDSVDKLFRVTAVAPQSPADQAGIRPEDQIVAINGAATAGCPHHEVLQQLRGPIGSAIAIKVLHPGSGQPSDLQLRRAYVVLPTVTMSLDGNVAVLRITSFNHNTTQRIATEITEAQRKAGGRLAGIVLDLRGNPGGLLDQAVSLTDLFVNDGPIIATTGRNPAAHQYFAAAGDSIAPKLPIVVLINGGSASASEIVAAALQDAGRAVVVGSSSYGKGTVQTVLRLPNDGELVVTWARLVSPAGYLLQSHGVVPTVCTADLGDDANALDVGLRRLSAAAPGTGLAFSPRAGLDEQAWAELRQSCPPRHGSPDIDLKLAERLLAEPRLYSQAIISLPAAPRLAQRASMPSVP
jgi:carboxyl-terminal processing protease